MSTFLADTEAMITTWHGISAPNEPGRRLAAELAPRGVRVNAICPGFIGTEMTEKLNEDQKQALFSRIPMARMGQPAEIAGAVLWLASDLSTYVTGQAITVDGGMTM